MSSFSDSALPTDFKFQHQWLRQQPNVDYSISFHNCVMKSRLIGKDPDVGKDWKQEEKGVTEDKMVGWHHWLNGHEFEQTLGDSERQGSLVCCSPWGCKKLDTTEWLNWTMYLTHTTTFEGDVILFPFYWWSSRGTQRLSSPRVHGWWIVDLKPGWQTWLTKLCLICKRNGKDRNAFQMSTCLGHS